jgi:glycosyltransferase involved in cell wall biosynthesis
MMLGSGKKKLLLVSALPPPNGGVASWTQTMLKIGLPNGFTLVLVNTRMPAGRRLFDSNWNPIQEAKRTISILFDLVRTIRREKPDVIHVNSSMAKRGVFRDLACVLLGRFSGRPVIVQYRGDVARFMEQNPPGLRRYAVRQMAHLATRNVVLNSSSRELLPGFMPRGSEPPLLIPNYIDDAVVRSSGATPGIRCARVRLLFVGGLAREKGTYEILELAKRFPEADFILVGCASRDLSLPREVPENFITLGERTREETLSQLSAAHIFLFPSYSEGFPNAVLEAMAVGLPIVASNVGAIPDMIAEGGGVLVAPGDLAGLTEAVGKLIGDAETRARYGALNRDRTLSAYVYSKVAEQLTAIYSSVLISSHHTSRTERDPRSFESRDH